MREFSNDSLYTRVENYDISQIGRVVSGLEEEYRYEEAIHLVDKCLEMAELKFKSPKKKKSRIAKNSYLETLKRKKRLIALQGKPVIQKQFLVILPRGLLDSSLIENRLSAISGTDNEKIDEAKKRLNAIKRSSPIKCGWGQIHSNDYLAYEFSESSSVMLESLKHAGNATFVNKRELKKLSKLSKREIAKHTGVKRIIHDCSSKSLGKES